MTDPKAVEHAIEEAVRLGPAVFREKHGFGQAREYLLAYHDDFFDSKAIVGVAHGYQHGSVLRPKEFSGGLKGAVKVLNSLGFPVIEKNAPRGGQGDRARHHLYYWRDYQKDVSGGPIWQLNQSNQGMLRIVPGDFVWTITNSGLGTYALAARFVVNEVGTNPVGSAGAGRGTYFFQSPEDRAVYFRLTDQPNLANLLVQLDMAADVRKVGYSFQGPAGVRWLQTGSAELTAHARRLAVDAALTEAAAIEEWHADDAAKLAGPEEDTPARREYRREMVVRNRALVADLKRLYGGQCQLSGERPLGGLAGDITEAHHIHWLTRGGSDRKGNMIVLSPDWHAAVHATNATFNWADLSFVIGGRSVPLRLNRHLMARDA